jgi:hypothetical protein
MIATPSYLGFSNELADGSSERFTSENTVSMQYTAVEQIHFRVLVLGTRERDVDPGVLHLPPQQSGVDASMRAL